MARSRFDCMYGEVGTFPPCHHADCSHNKSLQLSPKGPPVAVHVVPNCMQCWADAAGQLNSMLGLLEDGFGRGSRVLSNS